MSKLSDDIFKLRSEGKSYNAIVEELGCSKSNVSYHLGVGQKVKKSKDNANYFNNNPLAKRLSNFRNAKHSPPPPVTCSDKKRLNTKSRDFQRHDINLGKRFNFGDVVTNNPESVCYLSGRPVDFENPKSFEFDHIIPTSKGGNNLLSNLGVATSEANKSKSDLTVDQYLELCKDVLQHHGYVVTLK